MNRKTGLTLSKFDIINDKQFYFIGDAALLAGHVIYLILFHWLGVIELERYNYFSISFYILMLLLIEKTDNRNPFILLMILEIVVHSILSTLYMGWAAGFGQFMLCVIPIPFYLPIKKKIFPYVISIIDICIFIAIKLFTNSYAAIYTFSSKRTNNIVYAINSIFSFLIMIYMASNYIHTRNASQQKMKEQNEELQRLATIDPLTGLFNRRAMMEYLKIVQDNSKKTHKDYVIGLGDIDDFKKINDSFGHEYGDEALKIISQIIIRSVPAEGYVCRWGGEELMFAVPSSDMNAGMSIAGKIVNDVASYKFSADKDIFRVSITFGICQVASGSNFENGIRLADKRLYKGKNQGKNCVVGDNLIKRTIEKISL